MKRVLVESPYAAETEEGIKENVRYARACLADCLSLGEAPFASHLLYTQPGVLGDEVPEERKYGIEAGLAWGETADMTVVYTDLGITDGMKLGVERAQKVGREVVYRKLPYTWMSPKKCREGSTSQKVRDYLCSVYPRVVKAKEVTEGIGLSTTTKNINNVIATLNNHAENLWERVGRGLWRAYNP